MSNVTKAYHKTLPFFEGDEIDIINFRKIYDVFLRCDKKQYSICTDFYNMVFISKVHRVLKNNTYDIDVEIYGGYNGDFDRGVLVFTPSYQESYKNFKYIEVSINKFQDELTHREVLGSVVGLGVKREKIGDILLDEGKAYIICKEEIGRYIVENLTYIGRRKIAIKEAYEIPKIKSSEKEEIRTTVSSLRIDNFVATVTNSSRSVAKELIEKEKVLINHSVVKNFSKELQEEDVVTVRGFGRFYFKKCIGKSKKGKFIVVYHK